MAQTIKLKRSATPSAVPSTAQLDLGEIAINTYDGKLYIKKDDGTASVIEVGAGGGGGVEVSDTAPSSPSAGDLWFDSTDGSLNVYYTDVDSSQWVNVSSASLLSLDFTDINNTPTTLAGYGITDAASTGKAIAMAIVFG
jgi:hypothetical protein